MDYVHTDMNTEHMNTDRLAPPPPPQLRLAPPPPPPLGPRAPVCVLSLFDVGRYKNILRECPTLVCGYTSADSSVLRAIYSTHKWVKNYEHRITLVSPMFGVDSWYCHSFQVFFTILFHQFVPKSDIVLSPPLPSLADARGMFGLLQL